MIKIFFIMYVIAFNVVIWTTDFTQFQNSLLGIIGIGFMIITVALDTINDNIKNK